MALTENDAATALPEAELAEVQADLTAARGAAVADVPPGAISQSLGQYLRASFQRIRSGDSGILPVLLGLVLVAIVFEIITPENAYLRPSNLIYIFGLRTVYMVLAMAETVVLLLGEIDLSIGAVALMGGAIAFKLVQQPKPNLPWWLAILTSLVSCGLIGALQGTLVSRLKIPSFVVTLGGYLLFTGILIIILGGADGFVSVSSTVPNQAVIFNLVQGDIDQTVSWVALAVLLVIAGVVMWLRNSARRRSGLVAPPASLVAIRIVLLAVVGVVVVFICSQTFTPGVPEVIPIVLAILLLWTMGLQRTRFGRYIYAIGGNPEAARRAGVNLAVVRTAAFALCSVTAGFGGILLGSFFFGQYSTNTADPGQIVLYAVAAAVIGGTSLFGGAGTIVGTVVGAFIPTVLQNGFIINEIDPFWQEVLVGATIIVAVYIDQVRRRRL